MSGKALRYYATNQMSLFGEPMPASLPEVATTGRKLKTSPERRAYLAAWRAKQGERLKEHKRAYGASPEGRAVVAAHQKTYYAVPKVRLRVLLLGAEKRAAAKGLPFDKALFDTIESMPYTHCACCKRELDYTPQRGFKDRDGSPSFDRFNNEDGYTLANVRIICWRCNEVKSDAAVGELIKVLAYMKRGAASKGKS